MILANSNSFIGPSFTLRNRLARIVWQLIWILFFRPTPPPFHSWRCMLLRLFGAKIGAYCHVYNDVQIWAPWNLVMADFSSLGPRVNCYSMATVHLDKKVVVSQGVHLCTGSHDYNSANFQLFARPIYIGADAWVCTEAFLGPGVSIGEGAIIGARAVVIRDQPPWMVCAGNPCNPCKPRQPASVTQA